MKTIANNLRINSRWPRSPVSEESFLLMLDSLLDSYASSLDCCSAITNSSSAYKASVASKEMKRNKDSSSSVFNQAFHVNSFYNFHDLFKKYFSGYNKKLKCKSYYMDKIKIILKDIVPVLNILSEYMGSVSNTFIYRNISIGTRDVSIINPAFNDDFLRLIKLNHTKIAGTFNVFNSILHKHYGVDDNVYGFIKDKNCVDNANYHLSNNPESIINIDINKFFNNCNISNMIKFNNLSVLDCIDVDKETLSCFKIAILSLLFYATHNSVFPTGSAHTPAMSNFLLVPIDIKIKEYVVNMNRNINSSIKYSRYADDITISSSSYRTDGKYVLNISVIKDIELILRSYGFYVNYKKTLIAGKRDRKVVNGIILDTQNNQLSFGSARKHGIKKELSDPSTDEARRVSLRHLLPYIRHINRKQFNYIKNGIL